MNGYAASKVSQSHEEKLALIEERSLSDVESDSGRVDIESRIPSQKWVGAIKLYTRAFRISSLRSSMSKTAFFLLPSFIQNRLSHDRSRSDKPGPTAYLDGMRGLASLFVFFCHLLYTSFTVAEGWGANGENYELWRLPFVRLLFGGPSMVCVFFVVSGYSLSLKPLKQIRSRSFEGFATTMSSFIFRRAFRLFIPTMVSTFMVLVLLRLGFYEWTRYFASEPTFLQNVIEWHPELKDTLWEQLSHWVQEMFNFVHVWSWEKYGGSTGYDVHLWTIPVEYRCSMMLFLITLGTARLRPSMRLTCLAGMMWFIVRSDRWEMVLFLSGMVLAELDLIRGAHNNSASAPQLPFEESPVPERKTENKAPLWFLLSIPALYLLSCPDTDMEVTPGWVTLSYMIPEWFSDRYRFWQMIGSILFVTCVARSPQWQRLFTHPVVQYFGRISYAIYLMHGPVMHTVGFAIEYWAWSITGLEGQAYVTGFALAAIFNVPLVIWAADVFWRAVDAPTVRFAKWLESKVSISN